MDSVNYLFDGAHTQMLPILCYYGTQKLLVLSDVFIRGSPLHFIDQKCGWPFIHPDLLNATFLI